MCALGLESSCSAPSVAGGLDVDHAFDDCSSQRPVKAAPRNPAACAATCLPRRAGVPPTAPGYRRLLRGASNPSRLYAFFFADPLGDESAKLGGMLAT